MTYLQHGRRHAPGGDDPILDFPRLAGSKFGTITSAATLGLDDLDFEINELGQSYFDDSGGSGAHWPTILAPGDYLVTLNAAFSTTGTPSAGSGAFVTFSIGNVDTGQDAFLHTGSVWTSAPLVVGLANIRASDIPDSAPILLTNNSGTTATYTVNLGIVRLTDPTSILI